MNRNFKILFDYRRGFRRILIVLVFIVMLVAQAYSNNSSYIINSEVTPLSIKPQKIIDPITGQLVGTGTSATDFGSYSEK